MTNTTDDTERGGIGTFSEFTTDEFDGSGFAAGGLALDSHAVTEDDALDVLAALPPGLTRPEMIKAIFDKVAEREWQWAPCCNS